MSQIKVQLLFTKNVVLGHVPFNLASSISKFLKRDINKAFAKVVGQGINRRAGYGLEIPCVYSLYEPKPYIDKMKELVESLVAKGLL